MMDCYTEEDTFESFARTPAFLKLVLTFDLEIDFTKQFVGDNEVVKEMLRLHSKEWPKES